MTPQTKYRASAKTIASACLIWLIMAGHTEARQVDDHDERVARTLGELMYRQVAVDFQDTTAREALAYLDGHLRVPIVVRYDDDPVGHGLDPDSPVRLTLPATSCLAVLEEILEKCAPFGECTWQLRYGFVEVGTKDRLSVPAARERRTYDIRHHLIDLDIKRESGSMGPAGNQVRERRQGAFFALNIVESIVENVEPDAWDYGQVLYDEEPPPPDRRVVPAGPDGNSRRPPPRRRYVMPEKIATIRAWRDFVFITAPDYIHRRIGGYPVPIVPADLDTRLAARRLNPAIPKEPALAASTAGELMARTLSVDFQETPAHEAFEQLQAIVPPAMIIRYRGPQQPDGLDPETPITLRMEDATAREVLEAILRQCGDGQPCTWQTRRGFIEVGTKARLGRQDTHVLRMYDVHDRVLDPHMNLTNEEMADELMRTLAAEIEPGRWKVSYTGIADYGEETPRREVAPAERDPRPAPVVAGRALATVEYRNGVLIVRAPEFVHRQIKGYTFR